MTPADADILAALCSPTLGTWEAVAVPIRPEPRPLPRHLTDAIEPSRSPDADRIRSERPEISSARIALKRRASRAILTRQTP